MTFLKQIDGRWQGRGNASPRNLFQSAEPGFYLDFSTTQPLYQDTAAATPLTLPDQSVGLAADRSRARSPITVAAAVQASLGLRPKWGRMPKTGRRNLLTYTEQFDNAAWIKDNSGTASVPVVTANAATDPNGELTADLIQLRLNGATDGSLSWLYQNIAVPSGATRTTSFYVKAASAGGVGKTIRLTGTRNPTVTLTADWQRVSDSALLVTGATISFGIRLRGNEGTSDSVDLHIWGGQVDDGSTATAYQAVTNAFDVTEAGVPSYGYIRPDLMDDFLTVTTPAAQTGDVMVFGRKGTWLETGVTYGSGAAVSIGPTTMTGLPAGLLQAVQGPVSDISGGLVGVLAIGRTLTAAERTAALNYYKARGAAGLLVAGADVNPDPGFNTPGVWTFTGASPGWSISGGKAECTATAGGNRWILIPNRLTVGVTYLVTADVVVTAGGFVPDVSAVAATYATTSGTKKWIVTASITTLNLIATNSFIGSIDNVTFQPLTVTP